MADASIQFQGMERFDVESVETRERQEFVLAIKENPHVSHLHRKNLDGEMIDSAELVVSGRTIGLHDIYITSITVSGDIWVVTIQADRVDWG